MKKILLVLSLMTMLVSCTTKTYTITNYSERMEALEKNFPEIYGLYKRGDVIIDRVYYYEKKDGSSGTRVQYHYR